MDDDDGDIIIIIIFPSLLAKRNLPNHCLNFLKKTLFGETSPVKEKPAGTPPSNKQNTL